MTWLAELTHRRWSARVAGLLLVLLAHTVSADTNAPALALPATGAATIPAWMEVRALATNDVAWADLADAWRRQPDPESSPVEDFRYPIEHYDNGTIRAVLRAGKAIVSSQTGLIWAWQVHVEMRDPAGVPDGRIEAESCLYFRSNDTRRCYCPKDVLLVRSNAIVSGTGMYWDGTAQQMRFLSNAVLCLQRSPRLPGVNRGLPGGPTPPPQRIPSEGETAK